MRYYEARQRQSDGCWDWSMLWDKVVRPAGACADGNCNHKTKEEAEEHEAQRVREEMAACTPIEIDTKKGHPCHVKDCQGKAFYEIHVPGRMLGFQLCDEHLKDFSWYKVSAIWTS